LEEREQTSPPAAIEARPQLVVEFPELKEIKENVQSRRYSELRAYSLVGEKFSSVKIFISNTVRGSQRGHFVNIVS